MRDPNATPAEPLNIDLERQQVQALRHAGSLLVDVLHPHRAPVLEMALARLELVLEDDWARLLGDGRS
jgi:hypothetical protein